jgi:hypothetical protein
MKITLLENTKIIHEESIAKKLVVVGRSNSCDVVIHNEHLSRKHCTIEEDNGEFFITDHTSANGVYINNVRIPAEVRTPFSSFFQLSLGALECQIISDSDVVISRPVTPISKSERTKPSLGSHKEIKKKATQGSSSNNLGLSILGILILAGGAYYYMSQEEIPLSVETTPVAQIVEAPPETSSVEPSVEVKDSNEEIKKLHAQFEINLSASVYRDKNKIKNCQFHNDLCKKLSLSEDDGEGIDIDDNELFIFINPSKFKENPLFENVINSSQSEELIALQSILNSNAFIQFMANEYKQLHLVIIGANGLKTVFRFNYNLFSGHPQLKDRLINELTTGLSSGNLEAFWETAKVSTYQQNL